MTRVTNAELKQIITTNASITNMNFQKAKQALGGKVDKVTGKGLSANDFTTELQTKLNGVAAGAQVNVIGTVKVNGSALTPDGNKAVTSVVALKTDLPTVPTNVSSFTNDAGYLTSHQDVSDKCNADDVRDIISAVIGDLSITARDDITVS